jgi:hypothetical protein
MQSLQLGLSSEFLEFEVFGQEALVTGGSQDPGQY